MFARFAALLAVVLVAPALRAQTTVPATLQPIADQALTGAAASATIDLRDYFTVPGVAGQVAQFDLGALGKFDAELLGTDAPKTVQNFLVYVGRGAFTNTFFHRSVPGFVIQAGGYALAGNSINAIPADPPVVNEFKVPNERGTIAMAKLSSGPNTATNQWFINLADNRANLDQQNGGFTVFARVLGTGMTVVDALAAVRVYDASAQLGSSFTDLPLLNAALSSDNLLLIRSIKVVPLFPAAAGGDAVATFTTTSSNPAIVAAAISGSQLTLTRGGNGSSTITVRATDVNGSVATLSFSAAAQLPGAPIVTLQPVSQTIAVGGSAAFSIVAAGNGPLSYQWRNNGVAVTGATQATLAVAPLTVDSAGDYTVAVSNAAGSTISRVARLTVATPDPGRLANLSVRAALGADQPLFVGVTVSGGARSILVRAAGPALAAFGVGGAMDDPRLDLFSGQTNLASNDNWDVALAPVFRSVGAFAFATGSRDAAFTPTLTGGYTIQARGPAAGVVLVETYDLGTGNTPRMTNVSARNFVGTGENALFAGFAISGNVPKKLLIRAVGPSLTQFGVTAPLADPKLEIFDSNSTVVAATDNWGEEPQAADIAATAVSVGAFALASGSRDAAFVITLPAGTYSAKVSGVGGLTGDALVEVYEAP
jgi:cyclophilin family peptidyl-prolyl cis-trans isomerase